MTAYHKIDAPFMRDNKGVLLRGQWCRPEFEYLANNDWEFTEKVDGTNIRLTINWHDDIDMGSWHYGGRTDNAQIPSALMEALKSTVNDVAFDVEKIMRNRDIKTMTIYGEGYGPKINGGDRYAEAASFVVFDVKIGEFWLMRDNVNDFCEHVGLDAVPVLGTGTLHDAIDMVKAGITSRWGDFEAEGIVARPLVPLFNRQGNRIITKIKAVDFRR